MTSKKKQRKGYTPPLTRHQRLNKNIRRDAEAAAKAAAGLPLSAEEARRALKAGLRVDQKGREK